MRVLQGPQHYVFPSANRNLCGYFFSSLLDWDGWKKCCYEECFKHYKPAGAGSLDDLRCVARKHREARDREAAEQDQ